MVREYYNTFDFFFMLFGRKLITSQRVTIAFMLRFFSYMYTVIHYTQLTFQPYIALKINHTYTKLSTSLCRRQPNSFGFRRKV